MLCQQRNRLAKEEEMKEEKEEERINGPQVVAHASSISAKG